MRWRRFEIEGNIGEFYVADFEREAHGYEACTLNLCYGRDLSHKGLVRS